MFQKTVTVDISFRFLFVTFTDMGVAADIEISFEIFSDQGIGLIFFFFGDLLADTGSIAQIVIPVRLGLAVLQAGIFLCDL